MTEEFTDQRTPTKTPYYTNKTSLIPKHDNLFKTHFRIFILHSQQHKYE